MKIYKEESLSSFEFWSGACDTVKHLKAFELDIIESLLDDAYPDGMDETDINDLFWHEPDAIARWIGYDSFDEIMERSKED